MSDMNIRNSNLKPLEQSGKSQQVRSTEPKTDEPGQNLSLSQKKEVFENQLKLKSSQQTNLSEEDLVLKLDDISPKDLERYGKDVPIPKQLEQVRGKLERSLTLPVQNQGPQVEPLNIEVLRPHTDEMNLARHGYVQAKKNLFDGNEAQKIKDILTVELKPFLKELSEHDKLIGRSTHQQEQISLRCKEHMTRLLQNTGKRDDLSRLLEGYTKDEVKILLSEVVGELREGKRRTFDQLSEKKQNFVTKTLDGIWAGKRDRERPEIGSTIDREHPNAKPVKREPSPLTKSEDQLTQSIHKHIRSHLTLGQLSQLKTKSDEEILDVFKDFVGTRDQELSGLVLKAVRSCGATLPQRQVESYVKDLAPGDLGVGVSNALQQLSAQPGSHHAIGGVTDALHAQLQGLGPNHNTVWQLGVLSEAQLKAYLQSCVGDTHPLNDDDTTQLVREIRAMLPNRFNHETVEMNGMQIPTRLTLGGKEYQPLGFVAEAGFGKIFSYETLTHPKEVVAIKFLKNEGRENEEQQHLNALNELNLHRELQGTQGHKNVEGLIGAVHTPGGQLCMVLEYATGGVLSETCESIEKARKDGKLTEEARQLMGLMMLKQSLEGVNYMHEDREMLHTDLKAANLMLGQDGQVKLIDFGTAKVGNITNIEGRVVDNPNFLAPEQLPGYTNTTVGTNKSDMWSIGTLGFELLVGPLQSHPFFTSNFNTDKERHLVSHMNNVDSRLMSQMPEPQGKMKEVYDLIDKMMMPMPEQRISAREALAHPIFQDERLESEGLKNLMTKFSQPVPLEQTQPEFDRRINLIIQRELEARPGSDEQEIRRKNLKDFGPGIRSELEGVVRFERIQQDLQDLGLS